ncbi:MAG TPA: hypothetical protein VHM20_01035 [Gammaproteobacteria bacterium]|nr:hypothetical protein [Gammaproteobacteria bacterium]
MFSLFTQLSESSYALTSREQKRITDLHAKLKDIDAEMKLIEPRLERFHQLQGMIFATQSEIKQFEYRIDSLITIPNEALFLKLQDKLPSYGLNKAAIDKEKEHIILKLSSKYVSQAQMSAYFNNGSIPYDIKNIGNKDGIYEMIIPGKYYNKLMTWLSSEASNFPTQFYYPYFLTHQIYAKFFAWPNTIRDQKEYTVPSNFKLTEIDRNKIFDISKEKNIANGNLDDYKVEYNNLKEFSSRKTVLDNRKQELIGEKENLWHPKDLAINDALQEKFPQLHIEAFINRVTLKLQISFYKVNDLQKIKEIFSGITESSTLKFFPSHSGNRRIDVEIDVNQRNEVLNAIETFAENRARALQRSA